MQYCSSNSMCIWIRDMIRCVSVWIPHKHARLQSTAQVQWWTLRCETGFHLVVGTSAVFPRQWRFLACQSPSCHWWWRRHFGSVELEENPMFVLVFVILKVFLCVCVCEYPGSSGSLSSPVCWCCVLLQESLKSYGSQHGGKAERNSPSPPESSASTYTLLSTQKPQVQTNSAHICAWQCHCGVIITLTN